jgi:hypothetical protein
MSRSEPKYEEIVKASLEVFDQYDTAIISQSFSYDTAITAKH